MSDIYRGTTHDISFELETDISDVEVMWVTFSQFGTEKITKTLDDVTIDGHTVTVHLTQEDTLSLKPKIRAYIQIRLLMNSGDADITETFWREVKPCLKDGVIGAVVPEEDEEDENP